MYLLENIDIFFVCWQAIIIQKHVRCWLTRRKYLQTIYHIILVQSVVRRWLARRLYKKLKQEARSVEHVKKLNKGLENKIISLQQKIEELVSHVFKLTVFW
jgi:myosin-5